MSKCNYCAFFSHACVAPDWDAYATDILSEIDYWGQMLGKIDVPTIFFGGGTPSLMPTQIFARILDRIHEKFNVSTDAEITIESNPGTLDAKKLHDFISAGVNRLSIGVQSLNDDKLRFLGRRHSADDARRLIDAAMPHVRTSADFIYGLPGETPDDVIQICNQINKIGLRHASLYELTIEPNTPFGKMNLDMPTNDQMAEMYIAIGENLNIPRYEVSNYAATGHECIHNQNIWDGAAYIGIGPHAAGRVFMNNTWHEQLGDGAQMSPMTDTNRAMEKIITGMRTIRGVQLSDDVRAQINMEFVQHNPQLIHMTENRIAATEKGLLILDELLLNLTR